MSNLKHAKHPPCSNTPTLFLTLSHFEFSLLLLCPAAICLLLVLVLVLVLVVLLVVLVLVLTTTGFGHKTENHINGFFYGRTRFLGKSFPRQDRKARDVFSRRGRNFPPCPQSL
jgi:hypothetical protein